MSIGFSIVDALSILSSAVCILVEIKTNALRVRFRVYLMDSFSVPPQILLLLLLLTMMMMFFGLTNPFFSIFAGRSMVHFISGG